MNHEKMKRMLFRICAAGLLCAACTFPVQSAPQEIEYMPEGYHFERTEPEGGEPLYDVSFYFLQGRRAGGPYAVREGNGIGAVQWPADPNRDNYAFTGWYDNEGRTGAGYSADTAIHQNTELYAKWQYTGPGGYWPRPQKGSVQGIGEGDVLAPGHMISIIAEGYNMHLEKPQDQRFRWFPVKWRISESIDGVFSKESPFSAQISLDMKGGHTLYITYKEEIFDGIGWQETGQVHEVPELSFQIGD